MVENIFSQEDLDQIKAHGLTPDNVLEQIEMFKKGFPFARLVRPCKVNDGITVLDSNEIDGLIKAYSEAAKAGRCMKFVPASGAASRMFKLLSSFYNKPLEVKTLKDAAEKGDNNSRDMLRFIDEINKFPFYDDLRSAMFKDGLDIETSVNSGEVKNILEYVLEKKGLNLANIPKGLIPFHRYTDYSRTPFEEHLVEASEYSCDANGKAVVHFTVSPEHEGHIKNFINRILERYEQKGKHFETGFSRQMPHTDTVAVDLDNRPFRDQDGRLLFRPGGHGALIENISDINGDILFIKNIDNVVPDRLKEVTYTYKKALAGYLITLQEEIFSYLEKLFDGENSRGFVNDLFDFVRIKLSVIPPENILAATGEEKIKYLVSRLNRPLRICGMVRNVGEPGGGPFWLEQAGEGTSIHIVESSQIDMDSSDQYEIFLSATHFNPVDLVCGVRDFSGRPFDLKKYVDCNTGFISRKSENGKDLKALELPGLWNGSMAYWNSVFVEVPAITFNPVKTVFDLLRDEHQPV